MYELTKEYLQVVKLTGPGLGAKASGTVAGQLTFGNWKGQAYLKKKSTPKQPRTPPQVAIRALMTFASSTWSTINAPDQASWNDLARASEISPFNAYLKTNLTRWRDHLAPIQVNAPPGGDTPGPTSNYAAAGGVRNILLTFDCAAVNDNWGMIIYLDTAPLAPAKWNNLRVIIPILTTGTIRYRISPLPPGTYYTAWRKNLKQASYQPPTFTKTVVVT